MMRTWILGLVTTETRAALAIYTATPKDVEDAATAKMMQIMERMTVQCPGRRRGVDGGG